MHVDTDSKPYDTINVTPMLDLAYVLLVVFILMTTASIHPNRHPRSTCWPVVWG